MVVWNIGVALHFKMAEKIRFGRRGYRWKVANVVTSLATRLGPLRQSCFWLLDRRLCGALEAAIVSLPLDSQVTYVVDDVIWCVIWPLTIDQLWFDAVFAPYSNHRFERTVIPTFHFCKGHKLALSGQSNPNNWVMQCVSLKFIIAIRIYKNVLLLQESFCCP